MSLEIPAGIYECCWFFSGIFIYRVLANFINLGHTAIFIRQVALANLRLVKDLIENTELALEAKYGAMKEINISEERIKLVRKIDEKMIISWKEMTVKSIATAFPIKFQNVLRFKTWNEAMNFLREQRQNLKKK